MIAVAYAADAHAAAEVPIWQEPEIWLLVAFAIFVTLLAKPVWRRVAGGLDARAKVIAAELEEARKLRDEAQATLAAYQRKQRDAAKEAEEIVAHATEEARRLTEEAEAQLAETIARHEQLAEEKIALARAHAVEEVKAQAIDVAIAATTKILEERIDPTKAEALVEDAIKDLPKRLQ